MVSSFTSRYKVTKLVYYEEYATMDEAITREKQIKGGSRQRKIDLINSKNPEWKDLYDEFFVYHNLVIAKGNSDQRNLPHQEGIASSGKGPSSQ
jgi:hypothetical protein